MLDRLTAGVRELVDCEDAFGFRVKLALAEGGCIVVDGSQYPISVDNGDGDVATVLHLTGADLQQMLDGTLSPLTAYMQGRIRVDGDIGRAMKLARLFG